MVSHDSLAYLNIPADAALKSRSLFKNKQLENWANQLAIGSTSVAAHQMLEKLRSLNQCRYPYKERLQLHNTLRPVFDELLHALRQPLTQANIPLDQQQLHRARVLQNLLEQMALGYKLAARDLSGRSKNREYDTLLLTESIYMAIVYLSRRLVDAYALYAPEPEHVWADLNLLYLFAETRNLHQQQVDDPYPNTPLPIKLTIDHAYKRILLLSLAEPYHLMQYEADDMYRLISGSVDGCQLDSFSGIISQGEYLLDLNADSGPKYAVDDTLSQAHNLRTVDISVIKKQLNIHLQRLLASSIHQPEFDTVSMLERQQRDMLLRLADAWNASLVRKVKRLSLTAQVELTLGLDASHYFISEQQKFTPEVDELKLLTNYKPKNDKENLILAQAHDEALQKDQRYRNENYCLNPWSQINISPIGIALNCELSDAEIEARVGEVVTYRKIAKEKQRWQIGVIRWLKHEALEHGHNTINIGIMNIAHACMPVATKALKGLGSGTDYFRGLLVPKKAAINQTRSLIVPALLYDVGSVLVVNMKQKIFHAKLDRVILSTRSFTQFNFRVIQRPIEFDLSLMDAG